MTLTTSVQIIFEQPSTSDAFSGGGHKRTALELVRTIGEMKSRGGAIGLEGIWGAGKSTVIELARPLIEKLDRPQKSYSVLTFDLWAYQTEAFRHAFLGKLLDHAVALEPGLTTYASNTRKRIATKVTETTQDASRTYSLSAIYFLLVTPLLPLALAWLGPSAITQTINPTQNPAPLIFGLSVRDAVTWALLVGYALIFLRFLHRCLRTLSALKLSRVASWLMENLSQSASIFSKDADTVRSRTAVIDEDPAATKFRETFNDILVSLSKRYQSVVFVFDNIDRLPDDDVRAVWADIRHLFSRESAASPRSVHPIVVIPYDKRHVLNVMPGSEAPEQQDILAKTFDRVLRVSQPVTTDCRAYLAQCFEQAFRSTIDQQTCYRLFQVFDHVCSTGNHRATPRRVVAFTNDVSSYWAQWAGEIPLISIALYVAHRDIIDDTSDIAGAFQPISSIASFVGADPEWPRHILALTYNVSPRLAYQVALQPEIARLVIEPHGARELQSLAKLPGFGEVLVRTINENASAWSASDGNAISYICLNVHELGVLSSFADDIWKSLATSAAQMRPALLRPDVGEGFGLLLQHQSTVESRRLAAGIGAWMTTCVDSYQGPSAVVDGRNWINALDAMLSALEPTDPSALRKLLGEISGPAKPEVAIGAMVGRTGKQIRYEFFKAAASVDAIGQALPEYARRDGEGTYNVIRTLSLSQHRRDELREVIESMLGGPARIAAGNLAALADLYSDDIKSPSTTLRSAASDGTLLVKAYQGVGRLDDDLATMATLWILSAVADRVGFVSDDAPDDLELLSAAREWGNSFLQKGTYSAYGVGEFVRWVKRGRDSAAWVSAAIDQPSQFYRDVLKSLVANNALHNLYVEKTIASYESICSTLGSDLRPRFLRQLDQWDSAIKEVLAGQKVLEIESSLLRDIVIAKPPALEATLRHFDHELAGVDESQWAEALRGQNSLVQSAVIRRQKPGGYPKTGPLRSALLEHTRSCLREAATDVAEVDDWAEVVSLLQPKTRNHFYSDLYSVMSQTAATQEAWDRVLSRYGRYIVHMPLERNPRATVARIVVPLILSNNQGSLEILASIGDRLPRLAVNLRAPTRRRLTEALEGATPDKQSVCTSIMKAIRQRLRATKKSEAPS